MLTPSKLVEASILQVIDLSRLISLVITADPWINISRKICCPGYFSDFMCLPNS